MFVSIDFCLVPIGVGTSLSPYIKECIEVIKYEGLSYELGANGTAIEGDWERVFECVRKCHEKIHEKGAPRIYTTMKVNTRTDKEQKFTDKVKSVLGKYLKEKVMMIMILISLLKNQNLHIING